MAILITSPGLVTTGTEGADEILFGSSVAANGSARFRRVGQAGSVSQAGRAACAACAACAAACGCVLGWHSRARRGH